MMHDSYEAPEYDPYDYWEDLTYLSDGVYDNETKEKRMKKKAKLELAGKKRKRGAEHVTPIAKQSKTGRAVKSQPRSATQHTLSPSNADSIVSWVPQEQRADLTFGDTHPPAMADPVSLLKDWKDREFDESTLPKLTVSSSRNVKEGNHGGGDQTITDHEDDEDDEGSWEDEHDQDEEEDEGASTAEHPVGPGGGLDLGNISSIAELLAQHPDAIKDIAKANGLDLDAVELVLQDLIGGTQREFDDEEEDEESEPDNGNDDNVIETGSVKLVEQTPDDQHKQADLAKTIRKRGASPGEQCPTVVKGTSGNGSGEMAYSSFRPVRQAGPPSKKPRKK